MFKKFINLFKVKEDETLKYMNSDLSAKSENEVFKGTFNQEDEDEFFRQLEEEKEALERFKAHENSPHKNANQEPSRESVLKKMSQCMKERDWNPTHHPKILIALAVFIVATAITVVVLHETPNPLIGKWRPLGKNIFLPTGDIEFSKDKVHAMGNNTPVKYDIEKNSIDVIDLSTKMRLTFTIKDEKNIECTILGVKTSYKKADK